MAYAEPWRRPLFGDGCAPLPVGETVLETVGETPDGGIALVMAG
jgi:hypothetical protein